MLWLLVNVLHLEIYYYLQRQSMILGLFDGPFLPVSTAANAFEAPGQWPWFDHTLQLFCEHTRGVQDLNSWCSDQRWSGGARNSGDWWGWWYPPARDSYGILWGWIQSWPDSLGMLSWNHTGRTNCWWRNQMSVIKLHWIHQASHVKVKSRIVLGVNEQVAPKNMPPKKKVKVEVNFDEFRTVSHTVTWKWWDGQNSCSFHGINENAEGAGIAAYSLHSYMAACAVHCQQSPSNKILSLGNCRAKNLCRSQTSCTVFHPSLKLGPKLWHLEGSLFPREPLQRFRIQYYHSSILIGRL